MLLYHGSREIVTTPTFGLGSKHNDYGRGFYCTKEAEMAKEWACPSVRDGFMNKYELDTSDLNILYLNKEGYHILNWLALLLLNRTFQKRSPISRQANEYIIKEFLPDISGYDVICGYRADDSYFAYANDFLNNTISISQLCEAMQLGELGEQVVLISPNAFRQIRFLGYEIAEGSIYHPRRMARDCQARKAYLNQQGEDFVSCQRMQSKGPVDLSHDSAGDMFVREVVAGRVKNDDPRLQ